MKNKINTTAKPKHINMNGALITDEIARDLSARLALLGDQWQEICEELDTAGFGTVAATDRASLYTLAASEADRLRLSAYWREWAKERLAGLVGPINILRGKYPKTSAYRSELIAALRNDASSGKLKSEGPIVSPQFEPTFKRYIEMLASDPIAQQFNENRNKSRRQAALLRYPAENPEFTRLGESARYDVLIERYRMVLEPAGFKLDSHRKTGLVFRKLTSDKRWAFLLVDESRDGVETGSLSPTFALTLPKKAVLPSAASLNAVATFSPSDLVPRFHVSCSFERDSYAQFCLAADSISFLATAVYRRLDALLVY